MATDCFLKIDGIPGESSDNKHKEWIEIIDYIHSLKQPVSRTASSAGGATAERVNFGPFFVTKFVDKATPKILEAACTGKHIKEVIFEACRAGGDKQRFLEVRMEQVLISDYTHKGGSDFPTETFSFVPGKFYVTYFQQNRETGTLIGSVAGGWDLTTNKAI